MATARTVRFPVPPMKAVLAGLPADDDAWAFEVKWDGYRAVLFVDGTRVRAQSSRGGDLTATYPELAGFARAVNAESAVVDGELVVLDDQGRPRFELIQRHETEVAFYAFDVLAVGERDTIGLPYEARRALLADLVETGSHWMVPAHRCGGGAELLAATAAQGLEGVVAKRLGSLYVPGKRSPNWRKVKNRLTTRVVIGGYTAGTGARTGAFGALLVGVVESDGRLRFAGGVGTGFDQRTLESLTAALAARRRSECPFEPPPPRPVARTATWVEPDLVAEIQFAEWTNEGLVRHSSFVGLVEG